MFFVFGPPHANQPPKHGPIRLNGRGQMTTVTQAAEYLSRLIEQGFSDYQLKLGMRGIEPATSCIPSGRLLDPYPLFGLWRREK